MENRLLVRVYLAELADRALRFHLHLDTVEKEFYESSMGLAGGTIPQDKPLFLESFRTCIRTVLETVGELGRASQTALTDSKRDSFMDVARHAFVCINDLHERGLVHLPRPSEPVELRRFCRIISRHVLRRDRSDLAVYITEETAGGAFAVDPITKLKKQQFNRLVEIANDLLGSKTLQVPRADDSSAIHVTIARIDSRNPVRWPTLMHEAGHKLLSNELFEGGTLIELFEQWVPPTARDLIHTLDINMEAWLTEMWCDLFAAFVMGPALFFSQFAAFVCDPPGDSALSADHPPHTFRLRMIEMMLGHQHDIVKSDPLRTHIRECLQIVGYWDRAQSIEGNDALLTLFDTMRIFFQQQFFSGKGTDAENFQKKYQAMVRYVREIDGDGLERMRLQLSAGLPIASKPHNSGVALAEEPTSVQEVLLAAWLDRLQRVREATLSGLFPPNAKHLKEEVLPQIDRFDDAVLRSLQLAEWLHVLAPKEPKLVATPKGTSNIIRQSRRGMLADTEIIELLAANEIRVVDLYGQLGATSLDVRLGTSFEVFLPAYRRTPEATAVAVESYDSRRIDLDYLEHVILLPGQFMLGHSFEYFKFANWVAGDLEGRSSYARLGLEVHMTAGMIDPGFEGVVTFELYNGGPNPIHLFPGLRIAQLRFTCVTEPARPYSKQNTAKYRGLLQHKRSLYTNDDDFRKIWTETQRLDRPNTQTTDAGMA